jgi:hypothetical protein
MGWCDDRLDLDPTLGLTHDSLQECEDKLATVPLADLVRGWREMNTTGMRDGTSGTYAFAMYFDRLGHSDPDRALAFVAAVVADEPDQALVVMLARGKLLMQLLHNHAPRVVAELEAAGQASLRMRWLLGAIAWTFRGGMISDDGSARRLLAVADEAAFKAWERRSKAGREKIDFPALAVVDLAQAWIAERSPLARERDDQWSDLFEYQRHLAGEEPQRALALVTEIVRIEQDPMMLSVLSAGLLEDLLVGNGRAVIDAVEAEATGNPRFQQVLRGVWLSSADPDVAERIAKSSGRAGA